MEGYVEQNQRIREQIHATYSKLNFVGNSIPLDFQRQQLRLKCLVETECDCELMIKIMSRNEIIKSLSLVETEYGHFTLMIYGSDIERIKRLVCGSLRGNFCISDENTQTSSKLTA